MENKHRYVKKKKFHTMGSSYNSVSVLFNLGNFCPLCKGHLAMSGEIYGCHNWGGYASYLWVEARDAARHPAILGQPPTTKNYPAQNVMCEVEKPCSVQLIAFKTLEKEND